MVCRIAYKKVRFQSLLSIHEFQKFYFVNSNEVFCSSNHEKFRSLCAFTCRSIGSVCSLPREKTGAESWRTPVQSPGGGRRKKRSQFPAGLQRWSRDQSVGEQEQGPESRTGSQLRKGRGQGQRPHLQVAPAVRDRGNLQIRKEVIGL